MVRVVAKARGALRKAALERSTMPWLVDWLLTEKFLSIRRLGMKQYRSWKKCTQTSEQPEIVEETIHLLGSESTWIDELQFERPSEGSGSVDPDPEARGALCKAAPEPSTMLTLVEVGSLLMEKFLSIRRLGMKLYGSSNKWAQILEELAIVKQRIHLLSSESTWIDHQSAEIVALVGYLSRALSSLRSKEEELKIEKSRISWYAKLMSTHSKHLVELHEFILRNMQVTLDALDSVPSETFDFSHVRLPSAESAIVDALNNSKICTIILYGKPGSGKSTLARYLALQYLREARQCSLRFSKSSTLSRSSGARTPLFNRLLFVKCGPNTDAVSKYTEFIHICGQNTFGDQDMLVVLDDVCDGLFLQDFVNMCSQFPVRITYLVTSCLNHLRTVNSQCIQMRVAPAEAMAILASHIGFPNGVIPHHLQDIADRVVKHVDASPLLLARFASGIRNKGHSDVAVWREAELKLREEEKLTGFMNMKLSLMSLSKEAQNLLLLICVCRESSVPDFVLQVMYESSKFEWATTKFSQSRTELETWNWLEVTSELCEWNDESSVMTRKIFSLNTLHSQIVREEMEEKVDSLMSTVFSKEMNDGSLATETSNEDAFMTLLGAIFYQESLYSNRMRQDRASKLGINVQNLGKDTRSAIEPLLWLIPNIQHNEEHGYKWDETTSFVAKKVILSYLWRNLVKDCHINHLLNMPSSRRATCWALVLMFGNRHNFYEKPYNTMKTLADLLAKKLNHIQLTDDPIEVLQKLETLASNHNKFPAILLFLGFLKKLESIYLDNPSTYLESKTIVLIMAAETRSWLLVEHENGRTFSAVLESILGAIDVIIHSSFLRGHPIVQELEASRDLVNGSRGDQTELETLEVRDVAGYLMRLLSTDSHQRLDVALEVLRAFNSQSVSNEELERVSLVDHPKVLDRLAEFLDADMLEAQLLSAKIIAHLMHHSKNREIIFKAPNPLRVLVKLLQSLDTRLQREVSRAIASLCEVEIGDVAGCLMQILNTDFDLRLEVVLEVLRALNSQSVSNEELERVSLVDLPKVLDRLAHFLDTDMLEARLLSAKIIGHLAHHKKNREIIFKAPNPLRVLVKLLQSLDTRLRGEVSRAIASLCQVEIGDVAGCLMQILNTDFDLMLEVVLELLRALNSQSVLNAALWKISKQDHLKALDRLLQVLESCDSREAQLLSAKMIVHLAGNSNKSWEIVANSPNALKALVELISSVQ